MARNRRSELARLIHELLEARPDGFGHAQRFVRAGAEHREQRREHEHQHQHERGDCRQCLAAAKPADQPLIDRIAQAREDRRQQDRQKERADHGDERGRDRRDQQEQKSLAEAVSVKGRSDLSRSAVLPAYRDCLLRNVANPASARRPVSAMSAHVESVGTGGIGPATRKGRR